MSENRNLVAQPTVQQPTVIAPMHGVNFFDPKQFETVQRISLLFASSKLVPAMYQIGGMVKKGKDAQPIAKEEAIANCLIALDIASRIGAAPLMVMQNLAIIEGRPSWSSKFLIATVNTCGRFEPLKFKFIEKGNIGKFNYTEYVWNGSYKQAVQKEFDGSKMRDIECVAYTTKKGDTEVLESSPISLRMAIDEGWYTKNGSKWRTMPKQMLMYRAASFWTNAYAPELSMGMRTTEEQQDMVFADAEEVHEDVSAQVAEEKKKLANKEAIRFDNEEAQAHGVGSKPTADYVPQGVDPATGEIINPTAAADETPTNEAAPAY